MAFFLDSLYLELGRTLVLVAFMSIAGWTLRFIIKVWMPQAKSRSI